MTSASSRAAEEPRRHLGPPQLTILVSSARGRARGASRPHQPYGSEPASLFAATRAHAETERDLQAAGVRFTSQRNGFYATSALSILGQGLQTGEVRLPADGPVSWTAHADLADAAVIALTQDGRLNGITPALTGPEALDFADLAKIASELTGPQITRTAISDDDHVVGLIRAGSP